MDEKITLPVTTVGKGKDARSYQPRTCGKCKNDTYLTYLGEPMCMACWVRFCEETDPPLENNR